MISSQNHSHQGQDYVGSSTTEAYHTADSTSAAEEQDRQDYQQEQNNNRCMMLLQDMQGQIEFYFGVHNYARDTFLQQVVTANQGSVPISVIAQFPKIQQLYHGMMPYFYASNPTFVAPIEVMVCRSLASSRLIDVSNDGYYLRPNWILLQERDVAASHSHGPSTMGAYNSNMNGQHQVIKSSNGMNHTDATNTTVSPTSFASGSDGSVGPQSIGGDPAANAKLQPHPTPVLFNPTGGVYYVPHPQAYHYPYYAATTTTTPAYHHHPSMGIVTSPQSYPVATASFYRPNLESNGQQYYMSQPQPYGPPQPYPHYSNPPPPPSSMPHGMIYYDVPHTNDHHSKVPPPFNIPVDNSNQRSMPSPVSLNAPPSVIRLQDPFHDGTVPSGNFHKPPPQQPPQPQGNRKKNKSRLKRQPSTSENSNRSDNTGRSGLPNGQDTTKRSPEPPNSSQQDESQVTNMNTSARYVTVGPMPISTGTTTTSTATETNQTRMDDTTTCSDGNSRNGGLSIPKKEKNRVSGSQPHRTTSRPQQQPSNRPMPATTQPTHHRGGAATRGNSKNRLNATNNKQPEVVVAAIKKETNLLMDENFPSLTTGVNFLPGETTQNKNKYVDDSKKKKYAEALLHNPSNSNVGSTTQDASTVDNVNSSSTAATTATTSTRSHIGDTVVPVLTTTDVPAVTNLLDKFNLHK